LSSKRTQPVKNTATQQNKCAALESKGDHRGGALFDSKRTL
jgi:hypothetical protein